MSFKARKNQKYLLELMSKIIDEVEDETSNYLKPSCKKDVIEAAKSLLKKSKNEAGEWDNDFDYEKTANVLLYNISAKLLQSGKFVLVSVAA